MNKYIMLTKILPSKDQSPESFLESRDILVSKLREKFTDVNWIAGYALGGSYDYMDIFEAETNEIAMKISVTVRTSFNCTTEIWPATPIETFKSVVLNFEENPQKVQPAEDITDEAAMASFPASDPPATGSITKV